MKINKEILCGTSDFMSFPYGEYLQVKENPKNEATKITRAGSCDKGAWIEFLDKDELAIVL